MTGNRGTVTPAITPKSYTLDDRIKADVLAHISSSSCSKLFEQAIAQNPDLLIQLLENALSFDKKDPNKVIGFNKHALSLTLLKKQKELTASLPLDSAHDNLGITERFFTERLHANAYLAEVDMLRLMAQFKLGKNQPSMTKLDPREIGLALHAARAQHKSTDSYSISLLINKSHTGSVDNSGVHWARLSITVNPDNKKICIEFNDGMPTSSSEKARVENILRDALSFCETIESEMYLAYPHNYSIESLKINGSTAYADAPWANGYHALKAILPTSDSSDPALKAFKACENTEALRDHAYRQLLSQAQAPLDHSTDTFDASILTQTAPKNILPDYLTNFLKHVKSLKPTSILNILSAKALSEHLEQTDTTAAFANQYREKLASDILDEYIFKKIQPELPNSEPNATSTPGDGYMVVLKKLKVDFEKHLNTCNDDKKIKAMIAAMAKVISACDDLDKISLCNITAVPNRLHSYLYATFSQLTHALPIETTDDNATALKKLSGLTARNQLISALGITIDDDTSDAWYQIIKQRFANPGLYKDNQSNMGVLGLYSAANTAETTKQINPHVRTTAKPYLTALLDFIHKNKVVFDTRETGFPYQKLNLFDPSNSFYANENHGTSRSLNTLYLETLCEHLEAKKYFPFKEINLGLYRYTANEANFKLIKRLLTAANEYDTIEKIAVNIPHLLNQPSNRDFCSTDEIKALQQLYKQEKICIELAVHNGRWHQSEHKAILNNLAAINRRKKRADAMATSSDPKTQPEATEQPLAPTAGKERAYKINKANFSANVEIEISVDFQLQHTTSHEVSQVAHQHSAEILDNTFSATDSALLFDREKYSKWCETHQNSSLIQNAFLNQSPGAVFQDYHFIGSKAPKLWDSLFGHNDLKHSIKYATPDAINKLHSLPQHTIYGLNIDNLPAGFFAQQHEDGALTLCFDEVTYIENKNKSPLTLELRAKTSPNAWLGDLRQFVPNALTLTDESGERVYSDEAIESFNSLHEPGLRSTITVDQLKQLMLNSNRALTDAIFESHAWCLNEEASDTIQDLTLNNRDAVAALAEIFYYKDCEGVSSFLNALKILASKDKSLYLNIKTHYIDNFTKSSTQITQLTSPKSLNAIKRLGDMSSAERAWWKHLLAQHKQHVVQIDLEQLYDGFQYFLKQLPRGLTLPAVCPIDNCDNMLIALDRLLTILSRVPANRLKEQMHYLSGLSLSQEGAWYAARWDGYHFFHEAMALETSPDYFTNEMNTFLLGKPSDDYQVNFSHLKRMSAIFDSDEAMPCTLTVAESLPKNHRHIKKGVFLLTKNDNSEWILSVKNKAGQLETIATQGLSSFTNKPASNDEAGIKFVENVIAFYKKNHIATKEAPSHYITAFHRYLGRAKHIASDYEYYVELTNTLSIKTYPHNITAKLLTILAKVTTGKRGCDQIDSKHLFTYIDAIFPADDTIEPIETQKRFKAVLSNLIETIDDWAVTPNLNEVYGLIHLLMDQTVNETEAAHHSLTMLTESISVHTLNALSRWSNNEARIGADNFINLYKKLHETDADQIGYLALIAASIKAPYGESDITQFITAINALKASPNYHTVLSTLAAIDIDATGHENLPTLPELKTAINAAAAKASPSDACIALAITLPTCRFDATLTTLKVPALELSLKILEQINQLNSQLLATSFNETLDQSKLLDSGAAKYLNDFIGRFKAYLGTRFGENSIAIFKGKIHSAILQTLRGILRTPIIEQISQHPELSNLTELQEKLFQEPKLINDFGKLGEDFVTLRDHTARVGKVYSLLGQLLGKWPKNFSINSLINSPRTLKLSPEETADALEAFLDLDATTAPMTLFNALFSSKPFDDGIKTAEFIKRTTKIINLTEFTESQRVILVTMATDRPAHVINPLVENLDATRNKHPDILTACFELFKTYYDDKTKQDTTIIQSANTLSDLLKDNQSGLQTIVFNALAKEPDQLIQLVKALPTEKASQLAFIRIIAYGILQDNPSNETKEALFKGNDALLIKLTKLLAKEPLKFNLLNTLFDSRPCPGIEKLKDLLATENFEEAVKTYELDPHGTRSSSEKTNDSDKYTTGQKTLKAHFGFNAHDIRITDRINTITDLRRGGNALFFTHRKKLLDQFIYVDSIGRPTTTDAKTEGLIGYHGFTITAPRQIADRESYQKPACELTKVQIRLLISSYRDTIKNKGDKFSDDEVSLAKLEFIALAREVMYRTTGKFPYGIQIVSLLNTILHGGNIFSEIRTGEGKGIITALFAAMQWMEGGSVDVCTSNMALAGRDLKEFDDFYTYLGIKTTLIKATSSTDAYETDGINYSDINELALFQERVALTLNETAGETNTSLVLDECDFTALDNITQFRFSTSLDPHYDPDHNPNEWVYPILLEFAQNKQAFLHKHCSKQDDIHHLRLFAIGHAELSTVEKSRFSYFSDEQLDKWIDSAFIATQLIEDNDFAVREVNNEDGGSHFVAKVKIHHRISEGSSYSDGIHQLLHMRLGLALMDEPANDALVKAYKERTELKFPIKPEKTYLASRSAKNFIDQYLSTGRVLGLSGTVGSAPEIKEMHDSYGFKFFRIPPRKPLKREDLPTKITKASWFAKKRYKRNKTALAKARKKVHFEAIRKTTKKCQRRRQPALVICKDVETSRAMCEHLIRQTCSADLIRHHTSDSGLNLNALLSSPEGRKLSIQLYNGEQTYRPGNESTNADLSIEEAFVKRAAAPEMITISTPMLGRGTDIKLDPKKTPSGLFVINTYVDAQRDAAQTIGRAGRDGALGISQAIISDAEIAERYPDLKNSAEAIKRIKADITEAQTKERKERQYFSDIKEQFFEHYIRLCRTNKKSIQDSLTELGADYRSTCKKVAIESHRIWETFLTQIDKKWDELLFNYHSLPQEEQTAEALNATVRELATFSENLWNKAPSIQLAAKAHDIYIEAFTKAKERLAPAKPVASTSAAPTEPTAITYTDVTPITITPTVGEFKLKPLKSRPSTQRIKIATDLSDRLLMPAMINPHETYIEIAGAGFAEEHYKQACDRRIKQIYKAVLNRKPLSSSTLNVPHVLKKLLADISRQLSAKLAGDTAKSSGLKLNLKRLQKLLYTIEKFGGEPLKNIAIDTYTTYFKEHGSDARLRQQVLYQHLRAQNKAHSAVSARSRSGSASSSSSQSADSLGNISERSRSASNSSTSSDGARQSLLSADWRSLCDYAEKTIKAYQGNWFTHLFKGIGSSRSGLMSELLAELKEIESSTSSQNDQIKSLITKLDAVSLKIYAADYNAKDKYWFSYSNTKHISRFQESLERIRALATTSLITSPTDNSINVSLCNSRHLTSLIEIMLKQTGVSTIKKHAHIASLASDTLLNNLKDALETDSSIESYKAAIQLIERLSVYKNRIAISTMGRAQKSFLHLLIETINKLTQFTRTLELYQLQQSALTGAPQYATPLSQLYIGIQRSMNAMTNDDLYINKQIDLDNYEAIYSNPDDTEEQTRIRTVLFEIERLASLAFTQARRIRVDSATYSDNTLQVTLILEGEKPTDTREINITITHLFEAGQIPVCEWIKPSTPANLSADTPSGGAAHTEEDEGSNKLTLSP